MKRFTACFVVGLILSVVLIHDVASQDLRAAVVGIGDGKVGAGAVVLSSGSWGTDYLTMSHTLSVGGRYAVTSDGKTFDDSTPVVACSQYAQGVDVLVLRVSSHRDRTPITWGDPSELRSGDVLTLVPRVEVHPTVEQVHFVHNNLIQWLRADVKQRSAEWSGWSETDVDKFAQRNRPWQDTLVFEGFSKPGFSGSPVMRDGKVMGLLKGSWQPRHLVGNAWQDFGPKLALVESGTRIRQCLESVHYADLVPKP
jgi:hypothetical protein